MSRTTAVALAAVGLAFAAVSWRTRTDAPTAARFGFARSVTGSAVYDTPSNLYVVSGLPSGDHVAVKVKPANLLLPADTRVTAVGLTARPELNGQRARILQFDADRMRYGHRQRAAAAPRAAA